MKSICKYGLMAVMGLLAMGAAQATETLVFFRHAEKPAGGLGQLNCQGLNRALALPKVLLSKFGKPVALVAPNPGVIKEDKGVPYNYIRPLATIEPTAIRLGMPVVTRRGFNEIKELVLDLQNSEYRDGTVFVAWEHHLARKAVAELVAQTGGPVAVVPEAWPDDDFDALYVLKLEWTAGQPVFQSFEVMAQGLNGQPVACAD